MLLEHNLPRIRKVTAQKIKGRLEVRAKVNTRWGLGDDEVAEGSIGYVLADHYGGDYSRWLIVWPWIRDDRGAGTYGAYGSFNKNELEPTGNRG
jgi:hypothetical protein